MTEQFLFIMESALNHDIQCNNSTHQTIFNESELLDVRLHHLSQKLCYGWFFALADSHISNLGSTNKKT